MTSSIFELLDIIRALRDPQTGCPWDRVQTHESLRPFAIEEAYEVVAAIEENLPSLPDELGDLLLQVLLHSQIASESKSFDFDSVVTHLKDKLIRRHPHVFGDAKADSPEDVKKHWERIKQSERQTTAKTTESILSALPKGLPALLESSKIGKKVAQVNFDWDTPREILSKMHEEHLELTEAIESGNNQHIEEEIGDLFFTLAQVARKLGIDPESATKKANRKFIKRFQEIERCATKPIGEHSRGELETLWKVVKQKNNGETS
ncbi:MAG: nucleoside triphosphate pyrophosphohydrolase [Bdellovibrionales bacterium]|nr:nucleoside triphosphate pyrophosphohydrolase [Bdellovibrionales bacterium]